MEIGIMGGTFQIEMSYWMDNMLRMRWISMDYFALIWDGSLIELMGVIGCERDN